MFYKCVLIDHYTHVPVPVSQSSAESYYNLSYTAGMVRAHSSMLNNDFLNKDTNVVPEQALIVILDRKSALCMLNNGNYTKHTGHISRINVEELNMYKIVRCEVVLQLADIVTNNFRGD